MHCEPAAIKELDRQLNLNEAVLRTKVIRPVVAMNPQHRRFTSKMSWMASNL
jgi:ribosomal protein S6